MTRLSAPAVPARPLGDPERVRFDIVAWEAWSEGEVEAAGPVADQALREELRLGWGRAGGGWS